MLEELRAISLKRVRVRYIVVTVIALIIFILVGKSTFLLLKGPEPFENLTEDNMEGKYVKIRVVYCNGNFAEKSTSYSNSNKKTTNTLYYSTITADPYEPKYIGLAVAPKEEEKMNRIMEATERGFFLEEEEYGEIYTGTITKMSMTEQGYFEKFLVRNGPHELFQKIALPLYVREGYIGKLPFPTVIAGNVVAGLLLLYVLISFLLVRGGRYQRKLIKAVKADGSENAMTIADQDYTSGKDFAGGTKIGKQFTFWWRGTHTYAIKNANLVWAYLHKTTHSTNGMKTGVTYEVTMYDKDKKVYHIPTSSEAGATSILEYMANLFPHIVLGYDDELARVFRRDFSTFLNLRYYANQNMDSGMSGIQQPEDPFGETASSDPFSQTAASEDPFAEYLSQSKNKNRNDD